MWLDDLRLFLAHKVAPAVKKAEGVADAAIPDRVRGVRMPRARYLLMLLLLVIFVVGYWRGWHKRFVKPDPSLTPVATQGGGNVYQGNQVPVMAHAAKAGKPKSRVTVRPVATTPTAELPKEEQGKVPVVPLPTHISPATSPEAAKDNCITVNNELIASDYCRKKYPALYGPELADTQVVPPSRGETYTRAYLLPDGTVKIFQDPQREKFWGWQMPHLELEGGYGIGGKQIDVQATWLPLRLGNVHIGARAETWMESMGGMKAAGSIRVRWEPFR